MLSIRLSPETEERLSQLARKTCRTKPYYAKQLIEDNLDDLEDRYLAESRLEERSPALTPKQLRQKLGLVR